ncbi:MAG: enoyl-CoA hydratase/isomerase family protein [Nitrososphaerales archaeon]
MTEYNTLKVRMIGNLCEIALNRPEKMNAINTKMRLELSSVVSEVSSDKNARVIILKGIGKAFSAGADVSEFIGRKSGNAASSTIMRNLLRSLENAPQPTIAQISGYALGGGLELAMSCDLRIASQDAEMGLTEVNLGMIAGAGGTQRLPRIVGVPKAKELVFLGSRISASEAEKIGLVHHVVPSDQLEDYVRNLAEKISEKAPIALAAAKAAMNKVWESTDLDSGLLWERSMSDLCAETQDRQEGLVAFSEKRKPNFKGV